MLNVASDQAAGLRKILSAEIRSRLITFLSGASATENSLILTNLAASLNASGSKVLLVDARSGGTGVATAVGVKRNITVWDGAFGEDKDFHFIQSMPGLDNVDVVVLGVPRTGVRGSVEQAHLNSYFESITKNYDVVLVDGELTTEDTLHLTAMNKGDIVIQVGATSESITASYILMKRLTSSLGRRPYSILVTGVQDASSTIVYENIANTASKYLAVPLTSVGNMPADEHLQKASKLGRTVVDAFPLAGASVAFRRLAGKFSGSYSTSV